MSETEKRFSAVVDALKRSQPIVIVDDWKSPETAFVCAAAETISTPVMAEIISRSRGIIMGAISDDRRRELGLSLMPRRGAVDAPDFTVSVEAREGVTTGISAADRARTLQLLATARNARRDLISPGHIFPVRALKGGTLIRAGWVEAAVDLVEAAGFSPVAVVSHSLNSRGELAAPRDVSVSESPCFSESGASGGAGEPMPVIQLSHVVAFRLQQQTVVRREAVTRLPRVGGGVFTAYAYRSLIDDTEHLALVKGSLPDPGGNDALPAPLVRVQAEDPAGDLLDFSQCQSRPTLEQALSVIEGEGRGVFVYIRHPRRGLFASSLAKLAGGEPTQADLRQYGLGAQILRDLGISRVRLLTSGRRVLEGVKAFGIEVVERVPLRENS